MPALVLLGRKLKIGTDDLVIPYVFSMAARLIWTIPILCILIIKGSSNDMLLITYLVLLALLQSSLCISETLVAFISSRGTMSKSSSRRIVPGALYAQACLLVVVLAWSAVGIVWLSIAQTVFFLSSATFIWNVLVSFQVALYMRVIKADNVCGLFARYRNARSHDRSVASESLQISGRRLSRVSKGSFANHLRQKRWQWKLEFLLCCLRLNEENPRESYLVLANALTELFFESQDYVPSDIVAGLELIAMTEECPDELPKTPVEFNNDAIRLELIRVERYLRFACGSYGWPLYFHSQGCCRAYTFMHNHCRCCVGTRGHSAGNTEEALLHEDSRWNTESLKQFTGIKEEDLVYMSFQSEVFCPAFYIAYEHCESSVVLVIRGSLSLSDILTDISVYPSLLTTVGSLDIYTHKGVMTAAHTLQLKLEANKILDKAFKTHPEYKLILIGHSFGAGVATALAILFKPHYPNLHCYAFAPPGGLINIESVYYTRSFVTTIVVGHDMVPRLSQKSFESLSEKVEYHIKTCSVPKYHILLSAFLHRFGIHKWDIHQELSEQPPFEDSESEEDVLFERTAVQKKLSNKALNVGKQGTQQAEPEMNKEKSLAQVQLFVAGKVMHVTWECAAEETKISSWHKNLTASWIPPTNLSELFVGEDMFCHHFPDVMLKVFDELLNQEKILAVKT